MRLRLRASDVSDSPAWCAQVELPRTEPKLLTNRGPGQKLHHWYHWHHRRTTDGDGIGDQLVEEGGSFSPSSRRGRDSDLVSPGRHWDSGAGMLRYAHSRSPVRPAGDVQVRWGEQVHLTCRG